jgi:hypothetical protein
MKELVSKEKSFESNRDQSLLNVIWIRRNLLFLNHCLVKRIKHISKSGLPKTLN